MFRAHVVENRSQSEKKAGVQWTHAHMKVHSLYLFDIVACLCTCFNKQNIHLFCSLFSFLCGYLSVTSHNHRAPAKQPGDAHTDAHINTQTGEKQKNSTVYNYLTVHWKAVPLPAALLLPPDQKTRSLMSPQPALEMHLRQDLDSLTKRCHHIFRNNQIFSQCLITNDLSSCQRSQIIRDIWGFWSWSPGQHRQQDYRARLTHNFTCFTL